MLDLVAEHDALERARAQLVVVSGRERSREVSALLFACDVVSRALEEARAGRRATAAVGDELFVSARRGDPLRLERDETSVRFAPPLGTMGAPEDARAYVLAPLSAVAELTEAMDDATLSLWGAMGDAFGDITATPQGQAAWQSIQNELATEGANQLDVLGAKTAFANSFAQLTGQFGVDPQTALNAATSYAMQAQTLLGAVNNVSGLIAAANDPATAPGALISSFTGTLVAIAIAAGASAGVGGAIVAAVAAVLQILQSVGWLPQPPQGATIPGCAGRVHITNPDNVIVIGCTVGVYPSKDATQVASAQNKGWRRFPEPTNTADAGWFVANTSSSTRSGPFSWQGGAWEGDGDPRLVDLAWPQYHHLECERQNLLPGAPGQFQSAFFAAWKLNREMQLNGQRAAEDWQVLLHTIELWNRAHEAGQPYTFPAKGTDQDFMPASADCSTYGTYGPYVSFLGADIASKSGQGQPQSVTINTGALKTVLRQAGTPSLFKPLGAPTGLSTGAKVALGAGVVAAGAAGAWLALGRPVSVEAAKLALGRIFAKGA